MCGIFGFQTKNNAVLSAEQRGVLLTMLSLGNETRGDDSWGFYNHRELIKGLGGMSKYVYRFMKSEGGFGHTRRATTGDISVPNAHPFDIGNVIGAHNGIVFNHEELNRKYNRKHEVDSMHIFSALSEGKDLGEIRAYGAIEWIQKDNPNTVLLCRLSSGDLGIAALENRKGNTIGVVWSSDDKHLAAALTCLGIRHSFFKVEQGMVYAVTNGKLHTTTRKLAFASRTYAETGVTWEGGYSSRYSGQWPEDDSEDVSHGYQKWLKDHRGGQTQSSSTNLSSEQSKLWEDLRNEQKNEKAQSDLGSMTKEEERQLNMELERALADDSELSFGPQTSLEEELDIEVELEEDDGRPEEKKAFVVHGNGMILIPEALVEAELDIKYENIINGGSEFSHKLGGWVKFDPKDERFYVATNAELTTGTILL